MDSGERDDTPVLNTNILKTVRIASPCDASWEQMSGDQRSRLCRQCGRSVYDLSQLSSEEAIELLSRPVSGQLPCIRLYRRADGTILTKDCPVGVKLKERVRRAWRSLASVFSIFISVAISARADDSDGPQPKPITKQWRSIIDPVVPVHQLPVNRANQQLMGEPGFDFGPWMKALEERILLQTKGSGADFPLGAVVTFKVDFKGEVSKLKLVQSCDDDSCDARALAAVRAAAPFARLPDGTGDSVEIQFTFQQRVKDQTSKLGSGIEDEPGNTDLNLVAQTERKANAKIIFKGHVQHNEYGTGISRSAEAP